MNMLEATKSLHKPHRLLHLSSLFTTHTVHISDASRDQFHVLSPSNWLVVTAVMAAKRPAFTRCPWVNIQDDGNDTGATILAIILATILTARGKVGFNRVPDIAQRQGYNMPHITVDHGGCCTPSPDYHQHPSLLPPKNPTLIFLLVIWHGHGNIGKSIRQNTRLK